MQPNPNPNDIVRMQSQQHQSFPFNPQQYTLPITGAPQQNPQQNPQQALHQLQQPQLNQRRQRNMKKVPAAQPPILPRNPMPQASQYTFQQYLMTKCPQDPNHSIIYKYFSPNFGLSINPKILELLNPFLEDPRYFNFLKKLPIPSIFDYIPEYEPKVFFPISSLIPPNPMMPAPNGYEFKIDSPKPNISEIFLVCYYINNMNLQIIRQPNMKLTIIKQRANSSESVDCFQYGDINSYYVINSSIDQYPMYIKPVSESTVFIAVPCKPKSEEAIKRTFLANKPNAPTDISQVIVTCPCRQQTYNLDSIIKNLFIKGDVLCTACKKPILLDQLEIVNTDSADAISLILYNHFQAKIIDSIDHNIVDEFIDIPKNDDNNSNEDNEYQIQDFQSTREYIEYFNSIFSS